MPARTRHLSPPMHRLPRPLSRRLASACAVALLSWALGGCKPVQEAVSKADPTAAARALPLFHDAAQRMRNNDLAGALAQVRASIKANRSLPGAHLLLGQVQLALGDVIAAEAAYTEAQRLGGDRNDLILALAAAVAGQGQPRALLDQPRFDDAGLQPHVRAALLLMKAEAATDLGQAANAQRFVEAARALAPNQSATWLAEVSTRLRAGQLEQAAAAAAQALVLAPQSPAALGARGDVAMAQGDRKAALAMYERAIAAVPAATGAPASPAASSAAASPGAGGPTAADLDAAFEARVSRAGLLLEADTGTGNRALVDSEIKALIQMAPRDPRVLYLSAVQAERQGQGDAARAALSSIAQTLVRVPPEALRYRPQLLMLGGLAHLGLGEPDKARVHLETALQSPAGAPAGKLLAQSYLSERNLERAIDVLENYLKQRPDDQQAVLMLVGTQLALGRHTRAANLLQTRIARKDSPALHGMLAAGYVSIGGLESASTELALALKGSPGNTGLLAAQCALLLHSGQPAKALQTAQLLAQREPTKAGWQLLLGVAQLRSGQLSAARNAFETAIRLDDNFAAPRVALARLLAETGALDDAQTHLQALLQRQAKNSDALFELGRLSAQRGQLDQAQSWFEKAQASAEPGDNQATLALVDLHLKQNKVPAANAALRALALRAPDDLQVMLARARLAVANGDGTTARNLLNRATSLAGFEAGSLIQVAVLQLQLGQSAGAQYALEKALADNPQLLAAQAMMVDVELRLRSFDRAEARVRQLLAEQPRSSLAHALQGDVALARGQLAPALAAYQRAQQLEPQSAHMLRIHRTLSQTNPAAANSAAERWLAQAPNDHAVRRALADGQARLSQFAAARASYEVLAKATPGDAEALNNLAHVLVILKDPQAAAVAEKALAAAPGEAHIMGVAGWANIVAGQTEKGMNWLRAARLRDPDNPDTRYFLAAALAQLGRKADAREELAGVPEQGRNFLYAKETQALLETLK